METNSRWNIFVKYMVDVLFFAGIAVEILMPFLLRLLLKQGNAFLLGGTSASYENLGQISDLRFFEILTPLMVAGMFAILILMELRHIMKTVTDGDCFVEANVHSLQRMGIFAMCFTAFVFLRCILLFTLTAFAMGAVFLIAGCFCFVLAQVFDRAVRYKQNDDLTI